MRDQKLYKIVMVKQLTIVKKKGYTMKVSLCVGNVCVPAKCPVVDIQQDKVIIGEKKNVCTLTRAQFEVLRQKIMNGEI
jgi:hypothetical protein